MRPRRLIYALVLALAGSVPGFAACSAVEVLTDGTYVVTDCWGKSECITWATKDSGLASTWVGNAYMDGAMC